MATQPNQQNNPGEIRPQFQTGFKKASTHSEKLHLLDLKYHKGQVIKYDTEKGQQWAIKTADGEYVDLDTRKPLDLRSATQYLLKGSAASFTETSTQLKDISKNMMRYKEHMLTIDFETAITHGKLNDKKQVFNVAMARTHGSGVSKKVLATDYYLADIFDDILNPTKSSESMGLLKTMSTNIKKGYFKEFGRLAAKSNIDLTGIENVDQLVQRRDVLGKLMGELNQLENKTFEYKDATSNYRVIQKGFLGTTKSDIKRGLTFAAKAKDRMQSHLGINIGKGTTIGAFNVSGVDQPAMDLLDFGKDYNVVDLRGHQLFTNAALFPGLTDNLHVTLGPTMDRVANRLRLSDRERKTFFQQMQNGIGSQYNPGTSAEDIYSTLSYSLGYNSKLTHNATHHTALRDVFQEMQTVKMSDNFVDKALRETIYPGIQYQSPKARMIAAYVQHNAVAAQMKESSVFSSKHKKHLMGMFNRRVDATALQKEVSNALESSTSIKLERDMMHSNLKQFGGNTIAHLLAGSMLIAGARVAVNKARELFSDTKENNMEGLGHESIPTVMRRLSLTDFGSPRLNNPVSAGAAILMQMFRQSISNPKGISAIVKKSLSGIAGTIKHYKGQGSYLKMLNDPTKTRELTKRIFGQEGHIAKVFDNLHQAGHIEDLKTIDTVQAGLSKIRNIMGGRDIASFLSKGGSAKKKVDESIAKTITNLLVTRGKDEAGNAYTKLRAPTIALGAGAFGAFAIMLSRGKYDPEEMSKPLPNKADLKYSRAENDRKKIRTVIMDINNSTNEGLPLGSRDRQSRRMSFTDFGSGWRGILSRFASTIDDAVLAIKGKARQPMGGIVPKRVRLNSVAKYEDEIKRNLGTGKLKTAARSKAASKIISERQIVDNDTTQFFKMNRQKKAVDIITGKSEIQINNTKGQIISAGIEANRIKEAAIQYAKDTTRRPVTVPTIPNIRYPKKATPSAPMPKWNSTSDWQMRGASPTIVKPTRQMPKPDIVRQDINRSMRMQPTISSRILPGSTGPFKQHAPAKSDFIKLDHIDDIQAGKIKGSPYVKSKLMNNTEITDPAVSIRRARSTDDTAEDAVKNVLSRNTRAVYRHNGDQTVATRGIRRPKIIPEESIEGTAVINDNRVIGRGNQPITPSVNSPLPQPGIYSTSATTKNRMREMLVKDDMISRSLIDTKRGYDKAKHGSSGIPFIDVNTSNVHGNLDELTEHLDRTPIV